LATVEVLLGLEGRFVGALAGLGPLTANPVEVTLQLF